MVRPSKPFALGLLLLGCLLVSILTGCAREKVTQENYDKITKGMTLAEVEGLLGKDKQGVAFTGEVDEVAEAGGGIYTWESDGRTITIVFDKDMKVVKKSQLVVKN